jgi:hypothetical protein
VSTPTVPTVPQRYGITFPFDGIPLSQAQTSGAGLDGEESAVVIEHRRS